MANRIVQVAKNPDLITAEETAANIGVNPKTLQRWAREGRGPRRVRIGGRCYYHKANIETWLVDQFEGGSA